MSLPLALITIAHPNHLAPEPGAAARGAEPPAPSLVRAKPLPADRSENPLCPMGRT
jgi:hypothetical protein